MPIIVYADIWGLFCVLSCDYIKNALQSFFCLIKISGFRPLFIFFDRSKIVEGRLAYTDPPVRGEDFPEIIMMRADSMPRIFMKAVSVACAAYSPRRRSTIGGAVNFLKYYYSFLGLPRLRYHYYPLLN